MSALDSLGDFATNLNSFSLTDLNTGFLGKFFFFFKIALYMAIVFGIAVYAYKTYFQYKVRVTVLKKIGNGGLEIVKDVAKIITDEQNKTKLQFMKTRKSKKLACTCQVPEAKYKTKLKRFDHYFLFLDDNLELHPVEPMQLDETSKFLEVRPQERAAWGRMESDLLTKKYEKKDKFMKYADYAMLFTTLVICFLIMFFVSKEIGGGLATLGAQFAQVASACTRLG